VCLSRRGSRVDSVVDITTPREQDTRLLKSPVVKSVSARLFLGERASGVSVCVRL
jgi:hypothetical protein